MKTLTTLLATSVLLIGASAANAYTFEETTSDQIFTGMTNSKEAAYQSGLAKIQSLKSASPYELYDEVGLFGADIEADTVELEDGAYVTVQERLQANGQKAFVGVVNLDVSYEVHDDDD
ncbi:DUF3316 domain-containing protein [Leucothrix sargassi]|nr:DUF3316 domain-containing protein [Leucothrix sargassi]